MKLLLYNLIFAFILYVKDEISNLFSHKSFNSIQPKGPSLMRSL